MVNDSATATAPGLETPGTDQEDGSDERPRCPDCGNTSFSENSRGELVCQKCGLVIEDSMIADEPEWRAFSAEERQQKARTGEPITYTKGARGIETEIGSTGELYKVPGSKRGQYYRLRRWHRRATADREKSLGSALSEIRRMVDALDLPRAVHEEVARLYEKSVEKGLVKGRRMETMIGALIYIVARNQGTPRTLEDIVEVTGMDKREIGKAYRYIARSLDMRIKPPRPEDYLPKFASDLGVSGETHARARRILLIARENDLLSGKGPTGLAAAAIYLAAMLEGEDVSQKDITEKIGVTEVTIRNRYREFAEAIGVEEEIV